VSVYAEVEPGQVAVFVRDRGPGFDLDAIPDDRLGVRQSILGRMERHGGRAEVVTAPGEGTEVRLYVPRTPAASPAPPAPDTAAESAAHTATGSPPDRPGQVDVPVDGRKDS
jgi:signal transduction histidine kinase